MENVENESVYSVTMSMTVVNEHNQNDPTGNGTPALFVKFVRLDDSGNMINKVLFPWELLKKTVLDWIELEIRESARPVINL